MTDRIIDLLPSRDLKRKIHELNYQFTEAELLQIILDYAPTYDSRLALLDEFSKNVSPELGKVTEYFTAYQRELFRRFVEGRDGFIYELHIRATRDDPDETYICASYEAALECIDGFYAEYADIDTRETAESKYIIVKRRVFSPGDRFAEDADSECILGAGKTLLRVESLNGYRTTRDWDCDYNCLDCQRLCPGWSADVLFPCFAFTFSIVKYLDIDEFIQYQETERMAICLCPEECCPDRRTDAYCVIPMDCEPVRYHRFELAGNEHDHIPLPQAELIRAEDLDEEDRKNYDAFVQWWKDREKAEKTEDKN